MSARDHLWTSLKRLSDAAPVDLAGLIDDVSAAVDDARLAERRAIVALLRTTAKDRIDGHVILRHLAEVIERGGHAS